MGIETAVLILITLLAATVNGAFGYGFSSITVPVALLFYTNKVLNPSMVLVEATVNAYSLFINRKGVGEIWHRVLPVLCGLLPGILIGSYVLFLVTPGWLRLFTYVVLLPLILLQAAGIRRQIRAEKAVGLPFGAGIGFLYSITTISGPPLALMLNNQGYGKSHFRAALAVIRTTESFFTILIYYALGLFSKQSSHLLGIIFPSVLVGIPVGAFLIRRLDPETFRRICMSFDAWIVGFGLSKVLIELHLSATPVAYFPLGVAVGIDACLLYLFFGDRKSSRQRMI